MQIINNTNPAAPPAVAAIRDSVGGFEEPDGVRDVEIIHVQGRDHKL